MPETQSHSDQTADPLIARLDQKFDAFERRTFDRLKATEARIVSAICRTVEPFNARLTEVERETAAIKERLATLQDRLLGVEKRLDMPPRASSD